METGGSGIVDNDALAAEVGKVLGAGGSGIEVGTGGDGAVDDNALAARDGEGLGRGGGDDDKFKVELADGNS